MEDLYAPQIVDALTELELKTNPEWLELETLTKAELAEEARHLQEVVYQDLYDCEAFGAAQPVGREEARLRLIVRLLGEHASADALEAVHERWTAEFKALVETLREPYRCSRCRKELSRRHLNQVRCRACDQRPRDSLPV